jgi:hypothetical protein
VADHLDASEIAKDIELRQKARRTRESARCIEDARNKALVTSLQCARDGVEARIELRSSVEPELTT